MTSRLKNNAGPTCRAAAMTAGPRGSPGGSRSICLCAFSTMTIAASTIAPSAIAIPPKLMMLEPTPSGRIRAKAIRIPIVTLPIGILIAFALMRPLGVGSNIMSLGGIAIALGAMVDAAIVMVENAHKHIERLPPGEPRGPAVIAAARQVGPALFFSLLVITVSFLPVFALEDQEGRLFKPLAFTKTFAMAGAALLSVTLVPVLCSLLIGGRIRGEASNPIMRPLVWAYRPVLAFALRQRGVTLAVAALIVAGAFVLVPRIGREFMPPLNEGDLMFMPVTDPAISLTQAIVITKTQNQAIQRFP